jgi:xanthosine phosphorylase
MLDTAQTVAKQVASRAGFEKPRVAVVLGSGLGEIADSVKLPLVIPYANLPGFPVSGVSGHAGRMVLGRLGGLPVVVMQGRVHLYEGMRHDDIKTFVRTLKHLGCETIFVTNAAGSLRRDMAPGSLMMVNDHINLIPGNPLIGPNDDAYGDRFPTLEDAYDPDLRDRLTRAAERLDIKLRDGVYVGCLGPSFETPAEIRAYARLGGDAVGMSTVPEVIVARHCGLRVAALSVITNFAAGLGDSAPHGHAETLSEASKAATNVERLLTGFLEEYAQGTARTR